MIFFRSLGDGTFHAKKTNRWRDQNLDFDQNWSVYWKIHKQFNAKFVKAEGVLPVMQ